MTDRDPEAVIGEPLSEVPSPEDPERAEGVVDDLLAAGGGETTTYDLAVRTADGATLEVENRVSLLTHDGDPLGTVGVLVRTDGRPDGRLRRLHDATRELMAETDPERVAELTTEAARGVIDVADAAVSLADESGLGAVAATEGNDDAAAEPPAVVETGDLDLVTDDAPTVEADPERLRQLLENLFTNAAEHGDGATTITVGRLEDGFYVADDGVGIPEDEREGISESGRSGTEGGTGFGLSIVAEIAEAHGWTASATESETGGARSEFRDASDDPAA